MSAIDLTVLIIYFIIVILIGLYFLKRQNHVDEYFVAGRNMGTLHIGLSVIATDVGGGFSIGLGSLGFTMGLSGSWLLFSGLIGAWLSAVILIPKVKPLGDKMNLLTFPDYLAHRFDQKTEFVATIISAIGYAGFVGSQILAGAKLSSVAFGIDLHTAILLMTVVVILYTAFGGMEAVIATDIFQWGVLFLGLTFITLPLAYFKIGGISTLKASLPQEFFSLTNIAPLTLLSWFFTIIPIWFVGMTLYQRIYASKDLKTAKRAWYLAGLLEWPFMAFTGVILGMFARHLFPTAESDMAIPLLVKSILPIGLTGLVMAAYFSAIMSTADSCLLASVGNLVNDLYQKHFNQNQKPSHKKVLLVTRVLILIVGSVSVLVALFIPKILDAILLSYSFMVGGLFVPTLMGLLWKKVTAKAAFWSMITGILVILLTTIFPLLPQNVDPILMAIPLSFLVIVIITIGSKTPQGDKKYK